MSQWQDYSTKFSALTPREKYLILITGIVAIVMLVLTLFIDDNLQGIKEKKHALSQLTSANQSSVLSINTLEAALADDPNKALQSQKAHYQAKITELDQTLLSLTSELINPVEMRYALIELLAMHQGLSLTSFEVIAAQPYSVATEVAVSANEQAAATDISIHAPNSEPTPAELKIYRHSIKLTLQGHYFQLRDYLKQLESLKWKFFWQGFDYQLKQYPDSELSIEIYSLSTDEEFIGV